MSLTAELSAHKALAAYNCALFDPPSAVIAASQAPVRLMEMHLSASYNLDVIKPPNPQQTQFPRAGCIVASDSRGTPHPLWILAPVGAAGQANRFLFEGGYTMANEQAGVGDLGRGQFTARYPQRTATVVTDSTYPNGLFERATVIGGGSVATPFGLIPSGFASLPILLYTGFVYSDTTDRISFAPSADQLARQASRGRETASIISAVSTTSSTTQLTGLFSCSNLLSTAGLLCAQRINGNPTISAATLQQNSARPGDSCVNQFVQNGVCVLSGPPVTDAVLPLDFAFVDNDKNWTGVASVWKGSMPFGHCTSDFDGTAFMVSHPAFRENAWCQQKVGQDSTNALPQVFNSYATGNVTSVANVTPTPGLSTPFSLPTARITTQTDVSTHGAANSICLASAGQVDTSATAPFACPKMPVAVLPQLPLGWNFGFKLTFQQGSDTGRFSGLAIANEEPFLQGKMIPLAPIGTLQPLCGVSSTGLGWDIARAGLSRYQFFLGAALGSAVSTATAGTPVALFTVGPGGIGIRQTDGVQLARVSEMNTAFMASTWAGVRFCTIGHPSEFSCIVPDGTHPGSAGGTNNFSDLQIIYGTGAFVVDQLLWSNPVYCTSMFRGIPYAESTSGVDGNTASLISSNAIIDPTNIYAQATIYVDSSAFRDARRRLGADAQFVSSNTLVNVGNMMAPCGIATGAQSLNVLTAANSKVLLQDIFIRISDPTQLLFNQPMWNWQSAIPYLNGYDMSVTGQPLCINPSVQGAARAIPTDSEFYPTGTLLPVWNVGATQPPTGIALNQTQQLGAAISSWVSASPTTFYGDGNTAYAFQNNVGLPVHPLLLPGNSSGVSLGRGTQQGNYGYLALAYELQNFGTQSLFAADASPMYMTYFTSWSGAAIPRRTESSTWNNNGVATADPIVTVKSTIGFQNPYVYLGSTPSQALAPGAPRITSAASGAENGAANLYPLALLFSVAQQGQYNNLAGSTTAMFSVPTNAALETDYVNPLFAIGQESGINTDLNTLVEPMAGAPPNYVRAIRPYIHANTFASLGLRLAGYHVPFQPNIANSGAAGQQLSRTDGGMFGVSSTTAQFAMFAGNNLRAIACAPIANPLATSLTGIKNGLVTMTHFYVEHQSGSGSLKWSTEMEEKVLELGVCSGVAVSCTPIYNPIGSVLCSAAAAGAKGVATFTAADFARVNAAPICSGAGVTRSLTFTTPNALVKKATYVCSVVTMRTFADGILSHVDTPGEPKEGHCPFSLIEVKALALGLYATGEHQAQIIAWEGIGDGQQLTLARVSAIQIEASKDLVPFQAGGTGSINGSKGMEIADPRVKEVSRLLWTTPVSPDCKFKHCWPMSEYENLRKRYAAMDCVSAMADMLGTDKASYDAIVSAFGSTTLSAGATFAETRIAQHQDPPMWGDDHTYGAAASFAGVSTLDNVGEWTGTKNFLAPGRQAGKERSLRILAERDAENPLLKRARSIGSAEMLHGRQSKITRDSSIATNLQISPQLVAASEGHWITGNPLHAGEADEINNHEFNLWLNIAKTMDKATQQQLRFKGLSNVSFHVLVVHDHMPVVPLTLPQSQVRWLGSAYRRNLFKPGKLTTTINAMIPESPHWFTNLANVNWDAISKATSTLPGSGWTHVRQLGANSSVFWNAVKTLHALICKDTGILEHFVRIYGTPKGFMSHSFGRNIEEVGSFLTQVPPGKALDRLLHIKKSMTDMQKSMMREGADVVFKFVKSIVSFIQESITHAAEHVGDVIHIIELACLEFMRRLYNFTDPPGAPLPPIQEFSPDFRTISSPAKFVMLFGVGDSGDHVLPAGSYNKMRTAHTVFSLEGSRPTWMEFMSRISNVIREHPINFNPLGLPGAATLTDVRLGTDDEIAQALVRKKVGGHALMYGRGVEEADAAGLGAAAGQGLHVKGESGLKHEGGGGLKHEVFGVDDDD
jgi:hypothetical protein